jgi:phenylalanyl-tRNA synthetase beta chain
MKILLSWLLEHLDSTFTDINIEKLVHLFNTRTAEIESFKKLTFEASRFFIIKIVKTGNEIQAFCPELSQNLTLSKRNDASPEKYFMAVRDEKNWRWATLQDFSAEKEGLMPAMRTTEAEAKGSWKKSSPSIDYVLEVDNKSINHRPDLWGHYGIAQEVSAFLDIPLKPLDLKKLKTVDSSKNFSIKLLADKDCSRVAGILCNDVTSAESLPWMAIKLAQVDGKPINGFVDLTNYVMFDIGHPMHVFDASAFPDHEMIVRMGKNQEKLELLDGQDVELVSTDLVIANQKEAVSLPGVMGGKNSGWNNSTKNIILEAGGWDPLTIRKTAQRLKIRTESCMRFEKHLDPMQNVTAIERFIFLAQKLKLLPEITEPLVSVGQIIKPASCKLLHKFVENKLGTSLQPQIIKTILTKLGFGVTHDAKSETYTIIIPTNRMTKDIKIQEDLVEEIIRSYGFENLPVQLPTRQTQPFSIQVINNINHIKRHLAFALGMHEVNDYLLYDAAFTSRLEIDMSKAIKMKNSMSENWTTLVTSLIPHLLKSVETNMVSHDHLRFFEFNRIWHTTSKQFIEQKTLSGIIFDKKSVDFYSAKAELSSLFDMLKMEAVWQKPTEKVPVWFDSNQVAEIVVQGKILGLAGIMSPAWMHKITKGSAFIFELNGNMLEQHLAPQIQFKPWSKFQEVTYDISLFVPVTLTFELLQKNVKKADPLITNVKLLDFFEKEEASERAITLRYTISNPDKTMTKQELAEIMQNVEQAMVNSGAKIR